MKIVSPCSEKEFLENAVSEHIKLAIAEPNSLKVGDVYRFEHEASFVEFDVCEVRHEKAPWSGPPYQHLIDESGKITLTVVLLMKRAS